MSGRSAGALATVTDTVVRTTPASAYHLVVHLFISTTLSGHDLDRADRTMRGLYVRSRVLCR